MTGAAESHLLLLYLLISLITCTTALYAPRIQATNEGAWERAVAKGTVLFQQLESGCYPDAVNPIDLEALRAIGFHIGNDAKSHWPPVFQETSAFPPGEARRFSWTTAQQAYWRTSVDRVCKCLKLVTLHTSICLFCWVFSKKKKKKIGPDAT